MMITLIARRARSVSPILTCCFAAICWGLLSSRCGAGGFDDCFRGDSTVRTIMAHSDNACYPDGVTCDSGTITVTQQVRVGHTRQTAYRTQWRQVPVTMYRPIKTTDPVTGCTVTCMRPCRAYQWQARREPYLTYRPVYSTIAVNTAPIAAESSPYYTPTPSFITGAVSEGATSPYFGSPADRAPALPYGGVPAALQPGTVQPGLWAPGGMENQPRPAPPTMVPFGGDTNVRKTPAASGVRLEPVIPELIDVEPPAATNAAPTNAAPTNTGPTNTGPTNTGPTNEGPIFRLDLQPIPDPDQLPADGDAPASEQPGSRDKVAWRLGVLSGQRVGPEIHYGGCLIHRALTV